MICRRPCRSCCSERTVATSVLSEQCPEIMLISVLIEHELLMFPQNGWCHLYATMQILFSQNTGGVHHTRRDLIAKPDIFRTHGVKKKWHSHRALRWLLIEERESLFLVRWNFAYWGDRWDYKTDNSICYTTAFNTWMRSKLKSTRKRCEWYIQWWKCMKKEVIASGIYNGKRARNGA